MLVIPSVLAAPLDGYQGGGQEAGVAVGDIQVCPSWLVGQELHSQLR